MTGLSDYRPQRELDKFKETILGTTGVNIIDAVDAKIIKFDASDTAPDYIGLNEDKAAAEGDTDWIVLKFTYAGTAVTQIEKAVGSWTGRPALF